MQVIDSITDSDDEDADELLDEQEQAGAAEQVRVSSESLAKIPPTRRSAF